MSIKFVQINSNTFSIRFSNRDIMRTVIKQIHKPILSLKNTIFKRLTSYILNYSPSTADPTISLNKYQFFI